MIRPSDQTHSPSTAEAATVTVRAMHEGEEPQVRAVATRAFDPFDRLLFSTRGRETLVAVDGDDRVVGGVVLHATSAGRLGPLGIVHFIFADPEVPVRGIGTVLRDAADARFAELGCVETSARIDVTNSASQALHRAGGYRPTTATDQLRRWGWRMPLRWLQAGTGFDPGMQLWLRPAPQEPTAPAPGRALAVTAALNLLLLALVAWRAPRSDADALAVAGTLLVTVAVFLGLREAAIRLAARRERLQLGHVPWSNGLGLAGLLAVAVGVWFPLTGSSTSTRPGWRHDREAAALGRSHLAGALVVGALAWTAVLVEPTGGWLAWDEVRRAAVMLALFDLTLGFPPMIGTAARHVRTWSPWTWGMLALLGAGPLLTTLL
ncbi:MAG: GNAT family N-acetyltransferase [Nitriliruptoraceae bacterium]|nr:GNAT family N-acetyltransferase [Nitriliruptoraceae bacterium]